MFSKCSLIKNFGGITLTISGKGTSACILKNAPRINKQVVGEITNKK